MQVNQLKSYNIIKLNKWSNKLRFFFFFITALPREAREVSVCSSIASENGLARNGRQAII